MVQRVLTSAVGLALASTAFACAAQGRGPFAPGQPVATDAGYPAVAVRPTGDAVLAVTRAARRMAGDPPTGNEGLYVSDRPAAAPRFGPPVRVDGAQAYGGAIAINAAGMVAVAYVP